MIDKRECLSFHEIPEEIPFDVARYYIIANHWENNILAITVFEQSSWQKGEKEPMIRHFVRGREYRTFFAKNKESVASLGNLFEWKIRSGSYHKEQVCAFDPSFRAEVEKFLKEKIGTSGDALKAMIDYENEILTERLKRRHNKEKERIDQKMNLVGEIPQEFHTWIKEDVFRAERYIYYDAGSKKKPGKCSYCGFEGNFPNAKRRTEEKCPGCGSRVICYPGRGNADYSATKHVVLIQRIEEGIVFRRFMTSCRHYRNEENAYRQQEIETIETVRNMWTLEEGLCTEKKTYRFANFKQTGEIRWCEMDAAAYGYGMVYTENLEEVFEGTGYKYSGMKEYLREGNEGNFSAERYLHKYKDHPELEYISKRGFYQLAQRLMEWWDDEWAAEIPKLNKTHQRFLRESNGSPEMVLFLRALEKAEMNLSEKDLRICEAFSGWDARMVDILKFTSMEKLSNYLEKQRKRTEEEELLHKKWDRRGRGLGALKSEKAAFNYYLDYFESRAELGDNLTQFLPIIYISMEQSLKDVFGDFFKDLFQFIRKEKKKDAS